MLRRQVQVPKARIIHKRRVSNCHYIESHPILIISQSRIGSELTKTNSFKSFYMSFTKSRTIYHTKVESNVDNRRGQYYSRKTRSLK